MPKYIMLSFDDGRKDNYEIVFPMLRKYGFTASFHIVTGFVDGTATAKFNTMSIDNVKEMAKEGHDISSHGDRHKNTEEDLRTSLQKLQAWGIDKTPLLFSSPYSEIYEGNIEDYLDMLKNNRIEYVRSGVQIRRKGLLYMVLEFVQLWTKSKRLYYYLNKPNIMKLVEGNNTGIGGIWVIKSSCVKRQNKVGQLLYLIKKLQTNDVVCFLFHSVLPKKTIGKDGYTFSVEKFELFLKCLKDDEDITVLNISEYTNGAINTMKKEKI
jgi:hypothetical protein